MYVKDYSNAQLLQRFENAVARFTNYPKNLTIAAEFDKLECEMKRRLNIPEDVDIENVEF